MATRQRLARHNLDQPQQRPAQTARQGQWLDRVATGLALVLLVARPLFPSEDADAGTGLVPVALWGLVAVLWAASQAMRGRFSWFGAWVDLGPLVLLITVLISAAWSDALRAAINMASEWAGLILCYFLTRQLFRSPTSQRLFISALLGVAVCLAAYGIYQVFWGFESLRNEYARDRLTILQKLEIAPGSLEEETFKNRLNSHEPFATFALPNSLAGFLVAWLPLALVYWSIPFMDRGHDEEPKQPRDELSDRFGGLCIAAGLSLVMTVLVCLILTQSRTAYVAFCVELLLLIALFGRVLLQRVCQLFGKTTLAVATLAVVAITLSVIAIAWKRGKIDEMVFTQATKSFSYRLQYWRATVQMIGERPWSGTGPGNFRSHYLRYKLPESSEEISDPHNMVLELAATSGLVAGATLIGTLAAALTFMARRPAVVTISAGTTSSTDLWLAGLGGFLIAATLSGLDPSIYLVLFGVWCLASGVVWWLGPSRFDSRAMAIALVGLAIHFLGAGGISMPGVSQSFWSILAIGMNLTEEGCPPHGVGGPKWTRAVLLALIGLLMAFAMLVLQPVVVSMSTLAVGRNLLEIRDLGGAEARCRLAAEQDKLSIEPWIQLARIHYERWREGRGRVADEQFGYAVSALEQARRLAPSRLEPVRQLAELYEWRADTDAAFWAKAAEMYKRCVELYPNHAGLNARFAWALWQSGQREAARKMAARARQLDALSPHPDRKLSAAERKLIEPLQAPLSPVE